MDIYDLNIHRTQHPHVLLQHSWNLIVQNEREKLHVHVLLHKSKCFVVNYNQKYCGHIKHLDSINQHVNIILIKRF